jgi:hypothetical protein
MVLLVVVVVPKILDDSTIVGTDYTSLVLQLFLLVVKVTVGGLRSVLEGALQESLLSAPTCQYFTT